MIARRAFCAALAAALAVGGSARAEDGGSVSYGSMTSPFACDHVYLEVGGALDTDAFLAGPPGVVLSEILNATGLGRTMSADVAQVLVTLTVEHHVPAADGAGRLKGPETIAFTAVIRSAFPTDEPPVRVASAPHVVAGLGHFGAVGLSGWRLPGAHFVSARLGPALSAYLTGHAAGARIESDPPGATVTVGRRKEVVHADRPFVVRGLREGDAVEVRVERDGSVPVTQTLTAATADTLTTITLAPVAPPPPPPPPPPVDPPAPPMDPVILGAMITAALAGSVVAILWLKQRGIDLPAPPPPPPPPPPPRLKVLFFAANPRGTEALALDEETRRIRARLLEGTYRDLIDFIPYWATRFDDVLRGLNEHHPQVVHFSGHGDADGNLMLLAEDGSPAPLTPDLARRLFAAFAGGDSPVRLVLLNACFSEAQAESIRAAVDVTIGSTREIADDAAVDFAAAFYRAISFGCSVQNAYDQGLLGLEGNGVSRGVRPIPAPGLAAPPAPTFQILARAGVDPATIILAGAPDADGHDRGPTP